MKEIYAYSPKGKGREKAMVAVFGILGILLFLCSRIPGFLLPALWQIAAVLCLTVAIFLTSGYLLKAYVYAVAPIDRADVAPWELTVTELCGGRRTIVARIALSEIQSIERIAKEDRSRATDESRGRKVFSYTGVLLPDAVICIAACVGGEDVLLKIAAEDAFLDALLQLYRNNCPNDTHM
jgi:hypothetical protein